MAFGLYHDILFAVAAGNMVTTRPAGKGICSFLDILGLGWISEKPVGKLFFGELIRPVAMHLIRRFSGTTEGISREDQQHQHIIVIILGFMGITGPFTGT